MNAQLLSKENNVVKFTFEASAERFEEGLKYAYNKNKKNIAIPGFRKGKAPRKLIEVQYGAEFFYNDAINYVLNEDYEDAIKELDLDVVSKPEIDVPVADKEKGLKFEASVTIKPEITLGQYKGLEVEKTVIESTESEVLSELKKVQDKNARLITVEDRAAQMNDIANISYSGSIQGIPFEGGKSENHDLLLGSHSFIEGFEDQIVGHSIGETFDVNVTFPKEYHAPDLAGREAIFVVELKGLSMKELPELNDEFAEDVSEFSTLDEYKASIMDKLKTEKEQQQKQAKGEKLLDLAIANSTMDVPQVMIENKIDQMAHEFEENIGRQGLTMEVYCRYMGTSPEVMRERFRVTSEKSVKARLVLEQIVKEEKIEISKEDLDAEVGKLGESYGMEASKMLEMIHEEDRKSLEKDMAVHKAMELLEETAIEIEPKTAQ